MKAATIGALSFASMNCPFLGTRLIAARPAGRFGCMLFRLARAIVCSFAWFLRQNIRLQPQPFKPTFPRHQGRGGECRLHLSRELSGAEASTTSMLAFALKRIHARPCRPGNKTPRTALGAGHGPGCGLFDAAILARNRRSDGGEGLGPRSALSPILRGPTASCRLRRSSFHGGNAAMSDLGVVELSRLQFALTAL